MVAIKFLSIGLMALLTPNLEYCAAANSGPKGGMLDTSKFPSLPTIATNPGLNTQPLKAQPTPPQQLTVKESPVQKNLPRQDVPSCNASDDEASSPRPTAITTTPTIVQAAPALRVEEMLGKPFPPADLGKQDKPQVPGLLGRYDMPAVGWTVSQYLEDLLNNGSAHDAFTRNGSSFKNPKMRERVTEALAADMQTLDEEIKQILAATDVFARTEAVTVTAFIAAQRQRSGTFVKSQRSRFYKAMNRVDRLITMVATIEGAQGCLGHALIEDEHTALRAMKTSLEAGLNKHHEESLGRLQELEESIITMQQLQADELRAELEKVDSMLRNLHKLHPQQATLTKPTELSAFRTIKEQYQQSRK